MLQAAVGRRSARSTTSSSWPTGCARTRCETILGPLSWDEDGSPKGEFLVGQWQNGKAEIVLPQEAATADAKATVVELASRGVARVTEFLQTIVLGLLVGGVYALLASGLTLIFGVMRVINIAHGAFLILAAFLTYSLWYAVGLDPLLGDRDHHAGDVRARLADLRRRRPARSGTRRSPRRCC